MENNVTTCTTYRVEEFSVDINKNLGSEVNNVIAQAGL